MRIGYRHVGRILVIELDGGLGYDNFREFSKKVSDLMEKNGDLVVFDLGKCNYLSSWGVGALVSAAGKIRRNGGRVKFANLRHEVASIFRLMRLAHIFDVCETVDDALGMLEAESGGG